MVLEFRLWAKLVNQLYFWKQADFYHFDQNKLNGLCHGINTSKINTGMVFSWYRQYKEVLCVGWRNNASSVFPPRRFKTCLQWLVGNETSSSGSKNLESMAYDKWLVLVQDYEQVICYTPNKTAMIQFLLDKNKIF